MNYKNDPKIIEILDKLEAEIMKASTIPPHLNSVHAGIVIGLEEARDLILEAISYEDAK